MYRLPVFFLAFIIFISCSKDKKYQSPPVTIPDNINGIITEINLAPSDITTPDKASFLIFSNNVLYQVDFNAVAPAASNALLVFQTDTLLNDYSREFANLGSDVIAYNPVAPNKISLTFTTGKKVEGFFDLNTSFGGVFGATIISQWRDPSDPSKPTQKAKDDIIRLVHRYADKDGPGPETVPQYLSATVSKI